MIVVVMAVVVVVLCIGICLKLDIMVSVVVTAVQLVFNPFSQLVPQLELYSQLQLSLWRDPIALSVPKPT